MMDVITQFPEWLGTAMIGVAIAALGYVAKLIIEWIMEIRNRRQTRRARLVELLSILLATKSAYDLQGRFMDGSAGGGRDDDLMIKSITVNLMRPLNEQALDWLKGDTYFKAKTWGSGIDAKFAKQLIALELHLHIWLTKYQASIPENPSHSLVGASILGAEFPKGIQETIQQIIKKRW